MALPLPRVVSDVEAGGPLVTSMRALNSLHNDMLLRKINGIKEQYAPMTAQAEAASKLAYANLMGPQFLAKIMGNDSALGNMSEDQKRSALQRIYEAGSGQRGMNAFNQMPQNTGVGQPSTNSLSGWFADKLKNAFGTGPIKNSFARGGDASNPAQFNPPTEYSQPTAPRETGQSQVNTGGYGTSADDGIDHEYDSFINNWLKTPAGRREIEKGENAAIPTPEEYHAMKQGAPTYAENTGSYTGVVEEGKESGKIRAKDIHDLNNSVFNAETQLTTLNDINDILASDEFAQIRNTPLLGHHELSYYAKEGTPEQQQMVGKYMTLTGNLIKDASRDFAGQFRKGEQQLLSSMKPSASDTVDSAKGKAETLTVLAKMLSERSRLTSKYMSRDHINKLEASELADKQINGDNIRKSIHDRLNPTVTIKNRKTGETKTISVAEARKLGVPNV